MRSAGQISRTPAEYADWQTLERRRILRELLELLARARAAREPWLVWIEDRVAGRHVHDLRGEDGRPIACPVAGCAAVVGERGRRGRTPAVTPAGGASPQLELS